MPTRLALADLLSDCEASFFGPQDAPVTGLAYDSRQVNPGDAFVAIRGFVHDGIEFADAAIERGAVAVVAEIDPDSAPQPLTPKTWARVPNARAALAGMACRFYGHPSRELTVVGVTGTNGKTTVAGLLEAILSCRGPAGRWSTTTVRVGDSAQPAERTTPEAADLQQVLREMVDADCWAAAIEVSSHALALHRVDGTHFTAGVFTNLSPDHLDFHRDLDDYLDTKAGLFERLADDAVAVVNADDPAAAVLADRTVARVAAYGWDSEAHGRAPRTLKPTYRIAAWTTVDGNSRLQLDTPKGELELRTPLFGPVNAENIAAAATAALELGITPAEICSAVASFQGARGRFEPVDGGQPFPVLVDFAHTSAALEAALVASRTLAPEGKLIAVFGCGGDRDRSKRPVMGEIATTAAEHVVITSDNPRSEDPEAIIDEIEGGISGNARAVVERQSDRRLAIERALSLASEGDCVLLAGKGHETEQVFADRVEPFDDRKVALEWLEARYGGATRSSASRRADGSAASGSSRRPGPNGPARET